MRTVERLRDRFKKLNEEYNLRAHELQEIAEYFQPEKANFFGYVNRDAEDRLKIFDSTPEEASGNLAAALHSFLTNPGYTWLGMGLIDDADEATEEEKDWLDKVVKRMMAKFNSEEGGFQSSVHEFWQDLPVFGTAVFFTDEYEGIRFKTIPLSEVRIAENAKGIITTVFRCFEYTASQMIERWGDECSAEVKRTFEETPDKKFKVIHAVEPRVGFKKGSAKSKELPILSMYFEETSLKILSESGYNEPCYMVARWTKLSGCVYGRGPGHKSMPDVRVLNELSRSEVIAVDKASDPVQALPHDGFLTDWESGGGALNFHRIQGDIREKILTFGSEADLGAIEQSIVRKQESIKRMFLNHKLQMVGGPQKTAEEVREIVKQNMIILGPVAGRLQSEFLAPLVTRVFGIMYRNGELPEIPESLKDRVVKIQYISPITKSQKQTDADAVRETFAYLAPFAAQQPSIMKNFDFDLIARDTQGMFGYNPRYLKSPERVAQENAAEQAQIQKQKELQAQSQQLALAQQAKELRPNE